jgi:hypothetical protein
VDDCQNWDYHDSIIENGTLIVEASRKLTTGDSQDLSIVDDSSLAVPVH